MTTVEAGAAVRVRPERLAAFGDPAGCVFCLVTEPELAADVAIDAGGAYDDYLVVELDGTTPFPAVLDRIPARSHVLVVTPGTMFESPEPDQIGERKLMAMPCNSTPTSPAAVAHFLGVVERTDPIAQAAFAERFWTLAEASLHFDIVDEAVGTSAVFRHFDGEYEWNQQAGPIEWGEQQIAPSGELSALPIDVNEFDPSLRLALDGQLALRGTPILHSGLAPFTREDQARRWADLATMRDAAVVADVEGGVITRVTATRPAAEPAAAAYRSLFEADERYRIVWELGFGINTSHELLHENAAMNEVHGGTGGVFHVGIGLTPFTQYALITVCPGSRVSGADGEDLVTGVQQRRQIRVRRDGGGCGCRS